MFFYELSWCDLNDSLQKKDGFASFFLTFEAARQIKDEFGVKHFGVKLLQVLESDEIRCIEDMTRILKRFLRVAVVQAAHPWVRAVSCWTSGHVTITHSMPRKSFEGR